MACEKKFLCYGGGEVSHHMSPPLLRAFLHDEEGADAIEYGIIVALIFLVIVIAVSNMANNTFSMWSNISSHVK